MLGQMTSPSKCPMQSLTMGNTTWSVSREVAATPRYRWTAGQWSSATLQVSQWVCIGGRLYERQTKTNCFASVSPHCGFSEKPSSIYWTLESCEQWCYPKLFLIQCTNGIYIGELEGTRYSLQNSGHQWNQKNAHRKGTTGQSSFYWIRAFEQRKGFVKSNKVKI